MQEQSNLKKVWITKYALTNGLYEEEGIIDGDGWLLSEKGGNFRPNDYKETKTEAVQRAYKMSQSRIMALDRQIIKLKKMKFE